MRKSTWVWVFVFAIMLSVGLVAMVGCESSGSSSGDHGSVLASGNATITGGGHKLATVTAPTTGTLRWTVTRTGGGTGIIGISAEIRQGGTSLAENATKDDSISINTGVTAGQSYDLFASTSDTDVQINFVAEMK